MSGHTGWAWGSRCPSDSGLLNIAGSFHATPVLAPTAAEAQPSELVTDDTLALVEQTGQTSFRIIEINEASK